MRIFRFLARMIFEPDPRFVGAEEQDETGLRVDGNRTDVTPGPAWSRYLNAVSGRFIANANRPTDRPTPVWYDEVVRDRGGDLVNLYAV